MIISRFSNRSSYALLLSAAACVALGGAARARELSGDPQELARQLLSRQPPADTKLRFRAHVSEPIGSAQEQARELLLNVAARSPATRNAPARRASGRAAPPRLGPSDSTRDAQRMAQLMTLGTKG